MMMIIIIERTQHDNIIYIYIYFTSCVRKQKENKFFLFFLIPSFLKTFICLRRRIRKRNLIKIAKSAKTLSKYFHYKIIKKINYNAETESDKRVQYMIYFILRYFVSGVSKLIKGRADIFGPLLVHSEESYWSPVTQGMHVAFRVKSIANVERFHLANDRVLFGRGDDRGLLG